jgi:hypothetical protein
MDAAERREEALTPRHYAAFFCGGAGGDAGAAD